MNDKKKSKSDIVAAIIGKMLLKGYKMLAISCEECNNVIMQDREGRNICVNCSQDDDMEVSAVAAAGGDTSSLNHRGSNELEDVQKAQSNGNLGASAAARDEDHNRKVQAAHQEIELALLSEIQYTASSLVGLHKDDYLLPRNPFPAKEPYLHHIRDCANTIETLRSVFSKPSSRAELPE